MSGVKSDPHRRGIRRRPRGDWGERQDGVFCRRERGERSRGGWLVLREGREGKGAAGQGLLITNGP